MCNEVMLCVLSLLEFKMDVRDCIIIFRIYNETGTPAEKANAPADGVIG